MVIDVGKFYTIIKAVHGNEVETYNETEYIYGKCLLDEKNAVLKEFLERENKKVLAILENMKENGSKNSEELEKRLKYNRKARKLYD